MQKDQLRTYRDLFRRELLENCVPFWMERGWDKANGGVYTCLDRQGERFSPWKSVWAQGRFLWMLCRLCQRYGTQPAWLEAAQSCKRFLEERCFDRDGRMYFLVTEDGRPVRKRRYFFSETFYCMGLAEYARLTGDARSLQKARDMYDFVLDIYRHPENDPHQVYPKFQPEAVQTRSLGGPMIMLNVSSVLRACDPDNAARYDQAARGYIHDVTRYNYNPGHTCVFENVAMDGTPLLDTPMGRLVNPGHSIEAAWFLLSQARYFRDQDLAQKALNILAWSLELGWDKDKGGVVYFVDRLGYPPEPYEHDMKLWWPQCETVIATLLAYRHTGDRAWADWFQKSANYAFGHFKDPDGPEWVGYLHKDNTWQLPPAKGNYFKGPFHLPRMLLTCDQLLSELLEEA